MTAPVADPLRRWVETAPREELLSAIEGWPTEAVHQVLRVRFRTDTRFLAAYCFPDLTGLPFNEAHEWIFRWFAELPAWRERVALKRAETAASAEAPRGLAKTTCMKMALMARIVYGLDPLIVWGGPGRSEAKRETEHLRALLEVPPDPFAELYGPFKVWGGAFEWVVQVGAQKPVCVCARSFPGSKVRGLNWHGQRPTLIVGDDLEHPESVKNVEIRDALSEYIASDVRNAGPKEGGLAYFQVGTRLDPDSQTARNTRDPAFVTVRFQAMKAWPLRLDLWERCREVWANKANPNRVEDARAFFELYEEEMTEGAEVLDPVAQPLFTLFTILWSRGEAAFWKDLQNDPRPAGSVTFDLSKAKKCRFDGKVITAADGRTTALEDCRGVIWLDPRASKNTKKNDFGAVAVVVEDPHGYRYAIVVSLKRDAPAQQRARLWTVFERFPELEVCYEDNGFQALQGESFEHDREARERDGKRADMSPLGITTTENKDDVIAAMEPDIWHGWLQFADDLPAEFWTQMGEHPNGAHDDGPDAVSKAVARLKRSSFGVG